MTVIQSPWANTAVDMIDAPTLAETLALREPTWVQYAFELPDGPIVQRPVGPVRITFVRVLAEADDTIFDLVAWGTRIDHDGVDIDPSTQVAVTVDELRDIRGVVTRWLRARRRAGEWAR